MSARLTLCHADYVPRSLRSIMPLSRQKHLVGGGADAHALD